MTPRFLAIALAGLVAIASLGASPAAAPRPTWRRRRRPSRPRRQADASTQIERGRYLAHLGDCDGCHTVDGGKPFAGGLPFDTGFGAIYTPNITPDRETGIGSWTKDDFYRALHSGHDDQGKHLYPAFPYPWFTRVTRADVDAMKDYFDSCARPRAEQGAAVDWWMRWRPRSQAGTCSTSTGRVPARRQQVGRVESRRLHRRRSRPLRRLPHAQGLLRRRQPRRSALRRQHQRRPRRAGSRPASPASARGPGRMERRRDRRIPEDGLERARRTAGPMTR